MWMPSGNSATSEWSKLQIEPQRLDFEGQNRVFKTRDASKLLCF